METAWEEFYDKHPVPPNFEENKKLLEKFVQTHFCNNTKVVLVTVSIFL